MKRLAIALAAIGISATLFAALPGATDPTLVEVQQLPGGFVIGATGYYLQPSDSHGDLDYAISGAFFSSGAISGFRFYNMEPDYDWAWGVNVGYIFPGTGNDINLSYLHFDSNDSAHLAASGFLGPSDEIVPGLSPFIAPTAGLNTALALEEILRLGGSVFIIGSNITNLVARFDFDLNQLDLILGQFINIGCRTILHPYMGLRWASLERDLDIDSVSSASTADAGPSFGSEVASIGSFSKEKSDFNGVGPLAGIDINYYLGAGFGLVGHINSALLVGEIDSSDKVAVPFFLNAEFPSSGDPLFLTNGAGTLGFSAKSDDITRIVPVLDVKLGFDYTFVFNNAANSNLTLEAGWHTTHYFNAIDRTSIQSSVIPTVEDITIDPPPFIAILVLTPSKSVVTHTTSDFSDNGPYVSIQLHV